MNNNDIPDKTFSELNTEDREDIADYDEAMEESSKMMKVSSIAFACAWMFANDHITLREYMDILDDAEEQFDSSLS